MKSVNSSSLAGLIIDMQSDFLNNIEKKEREKMIQSQIELIHYLSETESPIFVLEYEKRGETIEEITKEIDFSKNEKPLIKIINDGFYDTGLHVLLKKHKSKNLILMGINAMSCVKATAQGALSRKGYSIYTARDLIAEKEMYTDAEMEREIKN
ncbi:MAG: isochorismatase family protein [Nanoarchaeota archaeon]